MKKPELLSPAGTLKNLRYAAAYGADAIYAGQPRYSLRVRNNEFDLENLSVAINELHAQDKKLYVVSNIQPHNIKLKNFVKDLSKVVDLGPDALIMSDPGMIMLARENFPEMPIHLSVQMNTINYASVKFWEKIGLSRIILSRELSLDEITQIRQECPNIELEVFIHGALCMAYSGRCLLSGYLTHRDSNQGACTNSCRWNYKIKPAIEDDTGGLVTPDLGSEQIEPHSFMLEEPKRIGELMPCDEDEHGTYIMNSKDLRAVELVPELTHMGVHSLKIEGRTKSHYYVARTAQVYRQAIDDAAAGKPFDTGLITALDGLANRGYTEGFLRRHVHSDYQNYEYGSSKTDHQQFVAEISDITPTRLTLVIKNKLMVGDTIEIMTPQGNLSYPLKEMWNKQGEPIDGALGSGWVCQIANPFKEMQDDVLQFALIMKSVSDPIFT